MAAVLTALRNACTDNGWTLAGNVLHKDGCYAEVRIGDNGETGAPTGTMLYVKAGNGIDGGNALTDAADTFGMIGPLRAADSATWPDWDWPVAYHVHVLTDPDEVYLFVNYGAALYWQCLAFGQSPSPGNAGTGNWHHAHAGQSAADNPNHLRTVSSIGMSADGSTIGAGFSASRCIPAPFWWAAAAINSSLAEVRLGARIHGAIDSVSGSPIWSHPDASIETGFDVQGRTSAAVTTRPLLAYSPNTYNNETHLFPIQVLQLRPSSKTSMIGELQHVRICRNDFLDPGEIITLGGDQWKVYPCYRKYVPARNGGTRIDHSGTFALAIRYDG